MFDFSLEEIPSAKSIQKDNRWNPIEASFTRETVIRSVNLAIYENLNVVHSPKSGPAFQATAIFPQDFSREILRSAAKEYQDAGFHVDFGLHSFNFNQQEKDFLEDEREPEVFFAVSIDSFPIWQYEDERKVIWSEILVPEVK